MATIMRWGNRKLKPKNPDGTFKQIYPENIQELLHPTQKLQVASVAKQFGMSNMTAYRRLRALGLYPKPRRIISIEDLERLYLKEERSLAEVSRLFSCDPDLIRNRLRRFGIPLRTHKEVMGLSRIRRRLGCRLDSHSNWRGGKTLLPYSPIKRSAHFWITSHYGRPYRCEFNSNHIGYDWANISGHYKKERSDWLRLCRSCHYWFDLPDIPPDRQAKLSFARRYAYLQGRERRIYL